jgi:phosphohistidine phosphatase
MMKLTLLRHGTAEDFHPSGDDSRRELIEKGRRQARNAGWYFQNQGSKPDLVLTSPYRRALVTAQLFCEEGRFAPPQEEDFLASGMCVSDAIAGLKPYLGLERVVIVGHQPDFGELVCYLTGQGGDEVEVGKGSLWEIEVETLRASGAKVGFYLSAKQVAALREA